MASDPALVDVQAIERAGVVITCRDFASNLTFFTDSLGFRVETIHPADGPTHASIIGHGCRLYLEVGGEEPMHIRLTVNPTSTLAGKQLKAPNGSVVECVVVQPGMSVEPLISSLVINHEDADGSAHVGRAGMLYRDLVPGRQGGAIIASLIRIAEGGPVPDYVHFHEVLFQLIFCRSGWVKVVYEDQGEPFFLHAGDCVIQPPTIRHRVLESGDNLEVIEIGYPAEHLTNADPTTTLPNAEVDPDRVWEGQSFIRHIASDAKWQQLSTGVESTDTGIFSATQGLTDVKVIKADSKSIWKQTTVQSLTFELLFVLDGGAHVSTSHDGEHILANGSSLVIPPGNSYTVNHVNQSQILKLSLHALK
ncbi:MAG: cupin domain-containing protein [Actinomycetes bacterium]